MEAKRERWGVSLINFGDKSPVGFIPGKVQFLENGELITVDLPNPYMVYANQFEMKKELQDVLRKMLEAMRAEELECQSTSTETQ